MIEKELIEKILEANGVDPSAPDEEIKSILFSAKWHKDDVDTALMVLRENATTHEQRVDSLQKVFHSDARLRPETITSLLGIAVDTPLPDETRNAHAQGSLGIRGALFIFVTAALFAAALFLGIMWHLKMGPFLGLS